MNVNEIIPTPIEVKTVGAALQVMSEARAHCLSASYHPQGGETPRRYIPIRHIVWLCGSIKNYRKFVTKRSAS